MTVEMRPSDVLLHPVRLRIAQAFLGERELTTATLRDELPDVATATLYRQVAAMVDGGVLDVVAERRVRGAVERTYRLRTGAAYVDADSARAMTPEDHRRGFLTFVAGLLADVDRYLDRDDVDVARDLVGYRQAALWLTDAETAELITALQAALAPYLAHQPDGARTRRLLATVLVPGAEDAATP